MSKLDIVNAEILRREDSIQSIIDGKQALLDTIEQFNKLDEFYREQEKDSRNTLECIYKENRHFTGQQPNVYSFAQTEIYPFFAQTDALCNPYFPITKVQDKTFDGLKPLEATVTKSDVHVRANPFAATEDIPRVPAKVALQNFPDYGTGEPNGEWLPANFPAAQDDIFTPGFCTPTAVPDTEAQCDIEGGVWTNPSSTPVPDPVWVPAETATAILRTALNAWRADIVIIRDDVCLQDATEVAFWQAIIDDIDIVLPAVAVDSVFVRNTGNPDPLTWGRTAPFTGAVEAARVRLETAANTGVTTHKSTRQAKLTTDGETEEKIFFGLMGLRLHQANGSYAKVKATKGMDVIQDSIKADHESALETLNLMKVKNS